MNFEQILSNAKLDLRPLRIETLQVNLGKLYNQACKHCHVGAGPKRTEEMMTRGTVDRCLAVLRSYPQIRNLDITGGTPELNDHSEYFVTTDSTLETAIMSDGLCPQPDSNRCYKLEKLVS